MKLRKSLVVSMVALCLGLTACGQIPAMQSGTDEPGQMVETEKPPAMTQPMETEPPATEPPETLPAALFPESDQATGTLCFYIDGKPVYAGGTISSIEEAGAEFDDDLSIFLDPGHTSKTLRARFTEDDGKARYLYVVAVNWTQEGRAISDCSIYSLAVNCQPGISFGSGRGAEPYETGLTTSEQLIAAYGQPDFYNQGKDFEEMAYYEPFSCAYFVCRDGVVDQIRTYYSAHVREKPETQLDCPYTEADSWMLMGQYLDVAPYLAGKQEVVTELSNTIGLGEQTAELGNVCSELPELWYKDLQKMRVELEGRHFITVGKVGKPTFTVFNSQGGLVKSLGSTVIKGVQTRNPGYHNWGVDDGAYPAFRYGGITQDSSIREVLEQLGNPYEILCTSNGNTCFAWLHFQNDSGITLKIMVDPALNQVVELRLDQHFKNEISYP